MPYMDAMGTLPKTNSNFASENRPFLPPKGNGLVFQASIFRGKLLKFFLGGNPWPGPSPKVYTSDICPTCEILQHGNDSIFSTKKQLVCCRIPCWPGNWKLVKKAQGFCVLYCWCFRNPKRPPGMYKNPRKWWDKLPSSTGDRRISEPSTVFLVPFGIPLPRWQDECSSGESEALRPLDGRGSGVRTFGKNRSLLKWTIYWLVVSNMFYFHPYLGKIPILTNMFQMSWNHQQV